MVGCQLGREQEGVGNYTTGSNFSWLETVKRSYCRRLCVEVLYTSFSGTVLVQYRYSRGTVPLQITRHGQRASCCLFVYSKIPPANLPMGDGQGR